MSASQTRILHKQENAPHYFFAPCPRGLAPALAEELAALGAERPERGDAGVGSRGPFEIVSAANLHPRIASRILWQVARFPYANETDIYERGKEVGWRDYFLAQTPPQNA